MTSVNVPGGNSTTGTGLTTAQENKLNSLEVTVITAIDDDIFFDAVRLDSEPSTQLVATGSFTTSRPNTVVADIDGNAITEVSRGDHFIWSPGNTRWVRLPHSLQMVHFPASGTWQSASDYLDANGRPTAFGEDQAGSLYLPHRERTSHDVAPSGTFDTVDDGDTFTGADGSTTYTYRGPHSIDAVVSNPAANHLYYNTGFDVFRVYRNGRWETTDPSILPGNWLGYQQSNDTAVRHVNAAQNAHYLLGERLWRIVTFTAGGTVFTNNDTWRRTGANLSGKQQRVGEVSSFANFATQRSAGITAVRASSAFTMTADASVRTTGGAEITSVALGDLFLLDEQDGRWERVSSQPRLPVTEVIPPADVTYNSTEDHITLTQANYTEYVSGDTFYFRMPSEDTDGNTVAMGQIERVQVNSLAELSTIRPHNDLFEQRNFRPGDRFAATYVYEGAARFQLEYVPPVPAAGETLVSDAQQVPRPQAISADGETPLAFIGFVAAVGTQEAADAVTEAQARTALGSAIEATVTQDGTTYIFTITTAPGTEGFPLIFFDDQGPLDGWRTENPFDSGTFESPSTTNFSESFREIDGTFHRGERIYHCYLPHFPGTHTGNERYRATYATPHFAPLNSPAFTGTPTVPSFGNTNVPEQIPQRSYVESEDTKLRNRITPLEALYEEVSDVGGTANAIVLTPRRTLTSHNTSRRFTFIALEDNTAQQVTVAISGLDAVQIVDPDEDSAATYGDDPAIGKIKAGSRVYLDYGIFNQDDDEVYGLRVSPVPSAEAQTIGEDTITPSMLRVRSGTERATDQEAFRTELNVPSTESNELYHDLTSAAEENTEPTGDDYTMEFNLTEALSPGPVLSDTTGQFNLVDTTEGARISGEIEWTAAAVSGYEPEVTLQLLRVTGSTVVDSHPILFDDDDETFSLAVPTRTGTTPYRFRLSVRTRGRSASGTVVLSEITFHESEPDIDQHINQLADRRAARHRLTEDALLDLFQAVRAAADRGKILAVATDDENGLRLGEIGVQDDDLFAAAAGDSAQTLDATGGTVTVRADHFEFIVELLLDDTNTQIGDATFLIYVPRSELSTSAKVITVDTDQPTARNPSRDVEISLELDSTGTTLTVAEAGAGTTNASIVGLIGRRLAVT